MGTSSDLNGAQAIVGTGSHEFLTNVPFGEQIRYIVESPQVSDAHLVDLASLVEAGGAASAFLPNGALQISSEMGFRGWSYLFSEPEYATTHTQSAPSLQRVHHSILQSGLAVNQRSAIIAQDASNPHDYATERSDLVGQNDNRSPKYHIARETSCLSSRPSLSSQEPEVHADDSRDLAKSLADVLMNPTAEGELEFHLHGTHFHHQATLQQRNTISSHEPHSARSNTASQNNFPVYAFDPPYQDFACALSAHNGRALELTQHQAFHHDGAVTISDDVNSEDARSIISIASTESASQTSHSRSSSPKAYQMPHSSIATPELAVMLSSIDEDNIALGEGLPTQFTLNDIRQPDLYPNQYSDSNQQLSYTPQPPNTTTSSPTRSSTPHENRSQSQSVPAQPQPISGIRKGRTGPNLDHGAGMTQEQRNLTAQDISESGVTSQDICGELLLHIGRSMRNIDIWRRLNELLVKEGEGPVIKSNVDYRIKKAHRARSPDDASYEAARKRYANERIAKNIAARQDASSLKQVKDATDKRLKTRAQNELAAAEAVKQIVAGQGQDMQVSASDGEEAGAAQVGSKRASKRTAETAGLSDEDDEPTSAIDQVHRTAMSRKRQQLSRPSNFG